MTISVARAMAQLKARHPKQASVDFVETLVNTTYIFDDAQLFLLRNRLVASAFIVDKVSALCFVNDLGDLTGLAAALYRYYGGEEADTKEAAEQYVLSGLGLAKLKSEGPVWRSYSFVVPGELEELKSAVEVLA